MAQTIEQLIAGGDITIGALDSKSRIAPVTRNGKPILITLSATPTLTTPFSPWPSFDGGERCSLDLRITPELEKLAAWIDETVQAQVTVSPQTWYSKVPKKHRIPLQFLQARREQGRVSRHFPHQAKLAREVRQLQGVGPREAGADDSG